MAHLLKIRKGWENENLAGFILSKINSTTPEPGLCLNATRWQKAHFEFSNPGFPINRLAWNLNSGRGMSSQATSPLPACFRHI